MHCWCTTRKKSFLSTFIVVTVIEDYSKFSQISCPAPKLVPNHHNWQWRARPSRVRAQPLHVMAFLKKNDDPEVNKIVLGFQWFHCISFCCFVQCSHSQCTESHRLGVSWSLMIFISINPGSLWVANHNKPPRDKSITGGDRHGKWRGP